MTLADKIINLRKQNGWSQEELAEKLDVTRQSVSKWEGAQSVPDISKILQISELFDVTTDYLLKDNEEVHSEESAPQENAETKNSSCLRTADENEARAYLAASRAAAKKIALGVFLCIISPVCMLLLIGASTSGLITAIPEDICVLIGIVALLLIVATAVMIFIFFGLSLAAFIRS